MSFLDKFVTKIPFLNKVEEVEYFFALDIGLSEVVAAVWKIEAGKLDILGKSAKAYSGIEDILEKANLSLDEALGIFEVEPKKILFGVPEFWVQEDSLKEQYAKLLKKLVKEFDLEPLAYVTTPQAISHLLQKEEGIPPSTLLLGIGNYVETTLLRGGKVIENRYAKRTDHLFDDIAKLLGQFTEVEVLPSKILLFSDKSAEDLEKIKDELMSYPWMSKFPFLHFPKIDVLELDIIPKALSYAGASESYPKIDLKHSFKIYKSQTDNLSIDRDSSLKTGKLSRIIPNKKVGDLEDDLGFMSGDISQTLSVGGNITRVEESGLSEEELEDDNLLSPMETFPSNSPTPHVPEQLLKLEEEGIKRFFRKILSKAALRSIRGGRLTVPLILGLAVFLAVILFYLLLLKATIVLFVEPRILDKETEVTADPNIKEANIAKGIIPAKVVETTVDGSDKGNATGQKAIGDVAKGKVIIYNLTSNQVSFSQGSILTSGNGLKFILDSSVQIASQSSTVSADFTTVSKPGKSDPVGISAQAIGPESNLPGSSELSLGNYPKSQVIAKVDEALSGGTSKNVTIVTSDDQKKLQARLLEDLKQKAALKLKEKLTDQTMITEALSVLDSKYSFSKQVNDQATEFNLSATVHFRGSAYLEADLRTIVAKLVQTDIPNDYELNVPESETQSDLIKVEKDGKLTFKAKFKAKLIRKYNLDDVKAKIKGKSISGAVEELKKLESVIGAEVSLKPNLPSPLGRIPILGQNIEITVSPK